MQLYSESGDIERDMAEFIDAHFGGQQRQITLLQSRIAARKRARKNTAILQRELVELLRQQVERGVLA